MNEPFHAYDIRSVFGAGIDVPVAYRIGRALARHLDAERYLLGHDARTHSRRSVKPWRAGLPPKGGAWQASASRPRRRSTSCRSRPAATPA